MKTTRRSFAFFALPALVALLFAAGGNAQPIAHFNIKTYGAVGDGQTLDTVAINKTIDAANAAGGGTVYFPPGTYASYSIHLRSNVTLYLEAGSTILAADPPPEGTPGGYDAPETNPSSLYQDFGHTHWHNSLIWGENLENIAIMGPGRIFGLGLSRGSGRIAARPDFIEKTRPSSAPAVVTPPPPKPRRWIGEAWPVLPDGVGNKSIALKNCRNVIFRDFVIFHGGHFAILGTGVDNWTIDGLKVDTNRDAMDIDCCQNVRVSNCTINSPRDDGLCLKSSFALGYARPTENVTITNCALSGYDPGTVLDGTRQRRLPSPGAAIGRIKFGTESNGGFRNITIANCTFEYCRGLALECVDGGFLEDITVTNVTMREIFNAPIFIRLGGRVRGPEGTKVGTARRIKIANLIAHDVTSRSAILIAGLSDAAVEDVWLSNIFIDYKGGGTKAESERIVPEDEDGYPEPSHFGVLPAWGLYARHVVNLNVDHVEFRHDKEEFRPAAVLDDVTDASFDRVKFPRTAGGTIVLKNVRRLTVHQSSGLPDTVRDELVENDKL